MTWEMILAVAGGVVLLGNAGAMIYKWIAPALKVKEDIKELDRRTVNDYDTIKKLERAIEHTEKMNRLQLAAMLNMMNHMIDGNGVEKMKETRDKLQDMLIDD